VVEGIDGGDLDEGLRIQSVSPRILREFIFRRARHIPGVTNTLRTTECDLNPRRILGLERLTDQKAPVPL
jgi:hypothetical protein